MTGTPPPEWLLSLRDRAIDAPVPLLMRPPEEGGRRSAILVLFGNGEDGPDVLLTQRGDSLRHHAGQPAFPGGAVEPDDGSAAQCALREAQEETGLDPSGVTVLAELPEVYLSNSGNRVTPILAWWRVPGPVRVADPREVAGVARVPVRELIDPGNRLRVVYGPKRSGVAFRVRGMVVWGFTAGVLNDLLTLAGWEPPNQDNPEVVSVESLLG
ncbi:NUDIX hydrolase [Spiractinospora alimapuensis]|uniref:NUDIX hydrolase n=1 Tax=Spiractinospora alimapuensis TaxID=2820884 RepID=UPI001F480AF7|nr:CoA pyrophosphatase [Spiractinospora alimapuensis]